MGRIPVGTALLTPLLIGKSMALRADLAAVIEQSREVLWRSRELQLLAYPRIRPIRGGSSEDAGLLSTLIIGVSLCSECLAKKSGISVSDVEATLKTIAGAVALRVETRRCDACLQTGTTFRLPLN
jgi:hypothetical protein